MDASQETSQREVINLHIPQDNPSTIPLSTTPLTWGVELKFVYAFHESKLKLGPLVLLDGIPHPSKPHKNLPYKFRRDTEGFKNEIPWESLPNRVYNSWGIHNEHRLNDKKTIPYNKEPHNILYELVTEKYPEIDHRTEMSHSIDEKEEEWYNEWLIMRDHSVCGVGSQNVPTWLPRVKSTAEWDSYGLELVSPIFKTDSNRGFREIVQILKATKGQSSDLTGAFITNQCGLHVHVQAPANLSVLKELAVLTIVYESEISKLHPHCRRPDNLNARYNIESNRLYFLHPNRRDRTRHTYGDIDCSNAALARQPQEFLNTIREEVNICKNAKELALLMNWPNYGLGNELGNRNRQVNFTAAARRKSAPYTIEFRQARGTLNAYDVQKWVEFCIGLMRLAQFYVDNPGRFPMNSFQSFLVGGDGEPVTERFYILDLMRDMGMSEEDKNYWRTRMARFAGKGGSLDRLDNEFEPAEGEEGQGIVGGDGDNSDDNDDSGDGPSGDDGQGGSSGNGSSCGDSSGGNNTGSSGGSGAPPPSPPSGGRKPAPKTGDKRPAGDDEDEDGQEGPDSKKQKKNNGRMSGGNGGGKTSHREPPGSDSGGEDNSGGNQSGRKASSPNSGDKRPPDNDDEDDEGQQKFDSKKPKKESLKQGRENVDNSQVLQPQVRHTNLVRIITTLTGLYSSVVPFMAAILSTPPAREAPPAVPEDIIPPDYERPTPGMIAPVGTLSPDEAHVFQIVTWNVQDFQWRDWNRQKTNVSVGRRRYVCAANALLQSMQSQYPDSPYTSISAYDLLVLFDDVAHRRVCNDLEETEVATVVELWTGGDFRAVVVSTVNDCRIAFRAGQLNQQAAYGRNLYVHHIVSSSGRGGHWEGMERRATPGPDPPPGRSVRPRGGNAEWFRY